MILDGNARVGEAKVYETALEMKQDKELIEIKALLKDSLEMMQQITDCSDCNDCQASVNSIKYRVEKYISL